MLQRVTEKIPVDVETGLKRSAPLLKMAAPFVEKKAAATIADFLNRRRETRLLAERGETAIETAPPPQPSWVERSLLPLVSALVLGIGVGISAGILWAKKAGEQ